MSDPIVLVSSYPPRVGNIAAFTEEAREFIQKHNPDRDVLVISHADGRGRGVFPIVDPDRPRWWRPVLRKLEELGPHVVHIQHDAGLYTSPQDLNSHGEEDFLDFLEAARRFPLVVEPHTVHGRMQDAEADFVYRMCRAADVVIFKCHYQKWRLDWTFPGMGWRTPTNIMIVPHGARPDRRYGVHEVPQLRHELGLDQVPSFSTHVVGLVGSTQANRRWDILTGMWEEVQQEIRNRTGQEWSLLAAGAIRGPEDQADGDPSRGEVQQLENKGLAHYFEFVARGDNYYRMMGVCDFLILPSTDESQSHMLARIIALNKPFITSAPIEGLTAQTLESGGGLLFTSPNMLREAIIRLACDEQLRLRLGNELKTYLENVVSWDVVARQYNRAYACAGEAKLCGAGVDLSEDY